MNAEWGSEARKSSKNAGVGAPGLSPETLVQLQRLGIWEKLKKGELHTITRQNVIDLFVALDSDEHGEIEKDDLELLRNVPGLTLTDDDLEALAEDCDKDKSGKVSVDELYKALTQGELAFNLVKESLGKQPKAIDDKSLELDKVIGFLENEYETSSALWSLPQTLVLFACFIGLMSTHLDLTTAYTMQTGLLNEIEGEGPPYLHMHEWAIVHDVPTVWQWMDSSGISLHFKNNDGDLDTWPYPGRVASYNQMIGGLELVKSDVATPLPCEQSTTLRSFYDTMTAGQCHRSGGIEYTSEYLLYHLRLDHLHEKVQNLTRDHFVDQNTTKLDVHGLYYNAHLQAFTDCHLTFNFWENGLVKVIISMETFKADPYFDKQWIFLDAVFVVILIRMLYSESSELIPAIRKGVSGLLNYLEFWNLIDWCAIIFGAIVIAYWVEICFIVSGPLQDKIKNLPTASLDALVFENRTYLTPEHIQSVTPISMYEAQISELHAISVEVAGKHELLRLLVFWYSFVLMMKFFKAFQANPRLDIVIRTLTKSAVEIIHFLIVFTTIFFCFSSAAYVVFGKAIKGFKDQYQAMFMCWRILMGEFEIDDMELVNYYYTSIWMVAFQFMVLLILLNMLLAIIMDTYVAAKQEAGEPSEQLTIWTQIKDACYTVKETQGHIGLYTLLLQLQDEDKPIHPAKVVTSKTLRRAFGRTMKRHQADYIIRRTVEWMKANAGSCDVGLSDTVRLLSILKVNVLRNVEDTQRVLDVLMSEKNASQKARFDAILNDEDPELVAPMDIGGGTNIAQLPKKAGIPRSAPQPSAATAPGPAAGGAARAPLHGNRAGNTAPSGGGFGRGGGAFGGGGGGFDDAIPGMDGVAAMLQTMQATLTSMHQQQERFMEGVKKQLSDQKMYIEERDVWLEQRINALERRCEKVDRGNEKVLMCLQGVDFDSISAIPTQVESALMSLNLGAGGGKHQPGSPTGGRGADISKRVEAKLTDLATRVGELAARAEEADQQRQLLWKIDLGIRELRQKGIQVQTSAPSTANGRRQGGFRPGKPQEPLPTPGSRDGSKTSSHAEGSHHHAGPHGLKQVQEEEEEAPSSFTIGGAPSGAIRGAPSTGGITIGGAPSVTVGGAPSPFGSGAIGGAPSSFSFGGTPSPLGAAPSPPAPNRIPGVPGQLRGAAAQHAERVPTPPDAQPPRPTDVEPHGRG